MIGLNKYLYENTKLFILFVLN